MFLEIFSIHRYQFRRKRKKITVSIVLGKLYLINWVLFMERVLFFFFRLMELINDYILAQTFFAGENDNEL